LLWLDNNVCRYREKLAVRGERLPILDGWIGPKLDEIKKGLPKKDKSSKGSVTRERTLSVGGW
jgi:hypothetical protein